MSDEPTPEGLENFFQQIFGTEDAAEEFAQSLEANQMIEAWKGIHEVYMGLRSGGFTFTQANGVMGAYLYHLITGIGDGSA